MSSVGARVAATRERVGRGALGFAIAFAALSSITCRDRSPTEPAARGPLAQVTVAASRDTLRLIVGQTFQLAATIRNPVGRALPNKQHTEWRSTRPDLATVDSTGLVTAIDTGRALVIADHKKSADTVRVHVVPIPVAKVILTPASISLEVGEPATLAAATLDSLDRPLAGRVVSWASSTPEIATVSPTGDVTGVAPGSATISATSEGKTATATVTVRDDRVASLTIAPRSIAVAQWEESAFFVATLRDASGRVLTGRTVTWQWLGTPLGALGTRGDTGIVSPILYQPPAMPTSSRVSASAEGKADTVSVTLLPPLVKSVRIGGNPGQMPAIYSGCGLQWSDGELRAEPLDLMGRLMDGSHSFAWATSGTGSLILRPSQFGDRAFITATSVGDVRVTATVDGVSGSTMIPVRKCADNVVTPGTATIAAGTTVQLTSTTTTIFSGTYVSPPARADIVWSSDNSAVATVDQAGRVTGIAQGTATISAAIDKDPYGLGPSATGRATVTVTPPAVTRIVVSGPDSIAAPSSGCVGVPGTGYVTAAGYDANGGYMPPIGAVWSFSPDGLVTATPLPGTWIVQLTALRAGTLTATATMGSVSGSRTIRLVTCAAP